MSWSASSEGRDKDKVAADFAEQMDRNAVNYPPGTAEGDDVAAVKARAAALMGALNLEASGYNGVAVKANGSHSTSGKGIVAASFSLQVTPLQLPAE